MVGEIVNRCWIFAFILVFSMPYAIATLDNSSPRQYNDTGIAYNQSFAYDVDFSTFSLINITGGNLSYKNFSPRTHQNTEDIVQLDVNFDIYVTNSVDDEWALQYSDDNGTTFNDMRSMATGNLERQNLSYAHITENNDTRWTWYEVRDDLIVRILFKTVGAADRMSLYIYELYALASYDVTPPTIFLQSPPANYLSRSSNASFLFNTSDDLSGINNCSLVIGNKANMTLFNVEMNTSYEFLQNFSNGQYSWNVNCSDNSTAKYENNSEQRSLTVEINYAPNITYVNISPSIGLAVASTKDITCNATLEDWNNVSDIQIVNATFYHSSVNETYSSDDSNIYRSNDCSNLSKNSTAVNVSCDFSIWYYAKPGEWFCNVSAMDGLGEVRYGISNTSISELYAINSTPLFIDFGLISAGETSSADTEMVVENLGNMEIDLTLEGYGLVDGDGLAMSCDLGIIGIEYVKYYLLSGAAYSSMIPLTDDPVQLDEFNLVPRNASFDGRKSVYWKINVPKPRKGNCTGFVTVGAVQS